MFSGSTNLLGSLLPDHPLTKINTWKVWRDRISHPIYLVFLPEARSHPIYLVFVSAIAFPTQFLPEARSHFPPIYLVSVSAIAFPTPFI
ncbi:hypothetical protein [Synechocystis sp. PCC 7509]|uniref:hypothetical protein n=1 Tax=Synechocystis sp. PCC 7509 TaxID=927677 RepID=UPI0011DD4D9B|nr:hypothetical protein [Synechocystis sp. PCC 7509]